MALSRADIQRAFQNSLGRGVSEADENFFLAEQQAGQTDTQIYAQISNSPEANLISDPVVRLYQSAFGRVPDRGGLDFFQDLVRDNGPSVQTYEAIARLFTESAEFTARYGSGTTIDAAYVQALYTNILGRQASSAEVNGWVSGAYGAPDRASLLNAVAQSQEASTRSDAAVNAFLLDTAEGDAVYAGSLYGAAPTPPPNNPTIPVNIPPVAVDDTLSAIAEDSGPRVITAAELLGNDRGGDGGPLRVASVTDGAGGTTVLNPDGTVTFTPAADFNGTASFTYAVFDGRFTSAAATASFTVTAVNDAPVVTTSAGTAAYTENAPPAAIDSTLTLADVDSATVASAIVTISTGFVTGQDELAFTDQNGITGSYNAATGALTLTGTATLAQYELALRSVGYANTSDDPSTVARAISFSVNDGIDTSSVATKVLSVTAVNDAPVANADRYTTNEDTPLLVGPSGVLRNDSDAEDPTAASLTASLATGPSNGSVVLNANGSFVYTPNANFFGTDSFTYRANDGDADSNVATAFIDVAAVNDAPVVTSAATASVPENTTSTVYTVTASDVDSPQGSLTYAISGGADANLFNINATTGAISFKVAPNFEAPADAGSNNVYDLFVTASDGSTTSAPQSVAVTVTNRPEGDRMLFVSDSTTDENIPTALIARGYSVDEVIRNFDPSSLSTPALRDADLFQYQAVYWSATGRGFGALNADPAMYTNLINYVQNGGYVFVTGFDSIASPNDPDLISFLGGVSSVDRATNGPVVGNINALSFGVVDIRGITPTGGFGDQDTLVIGNGPARPIVGDANGAGWSLRSVGAGQIAYVSNGSSSDQPRVDWTNTSVGGDGAYNAALSNFAYNAIQDTPFLL